MGDISISIILAQIINFLILFFLFKVLVAKKLFVALEERRVLHEQLKQVEKEKIRIIAEAEGEKERIIAEAKHMASDYIESSQKMAMLKFDAVLKKANADVTAILSGGEVEIERERQNMWKEVEEYIITTAIKLNEKALGRSSVNRKFLERTLQEIKKEEKL